MDNPKRATLMDAANFYVYGYGTQANPEERAKFYATAYVMLFDALKTATSAEAIAKAAQVYFDTHSDPTAKSVNINRAWNHLRDLVTSYVPAPPAGLPAPRPEGEGNRQDTQGSGKEGEPSAALREAAPLGEAIAQIERWRDEAGESLRTARAMHLQEATAVANAQVQTYASCLRLLHALEAQSAPKPKVEGSPSSSPSLTVDKFAGHLEVCARRWGFACSCAFLQRRQAEPQSPAPGGAAHG